MVVIAGAVLLIAVMVFAMFSTQGCSPGAIRKISEDGMHRFQEDLNRSIDRSTGEIM